MKKKESAVIAIKTEKLDDDDSTPNSNTLRERMEIDQEVRLDKSDQDCVKVRSRKMSTRSSGLVIQSEEVDTNPKSVQTAKTSPVLMMKAVGALLGSTKEMTSDQMYRILKGEEKQATVALRTALELGILVRRIPSNGPSLLSVNSDVVKVLKMGRNSQTTQTLKTADCEKNDGPSQSTPSVRRLRPSTGRVRKVTKLRRLCCCRKGYCRC